MALQRVLVWEYPRSRSQVACSQAAKAPPGAGRGGKPEIGGAVEILSDDTRVTVPRVGCLGLGKRVKEGLGQP
jgi:hypothetical protein